MSFWNLESTIEIFKKSTDTRKTINNLNNLNNWSFKLDCITYPHNTSFLAFIYRDIPVICAVSAAADLFARQLISHGNKSLALR